MIKVGISQLRPHINEPLPRIPLTFPLVNGTYPGSNGQDLSVDTEYAKDKKDTFST